VDFATELAAVVVHERDRPVFLLRRAQQLAGEHFARPAGADHQHPRALAQVQGLVPEPAVHHAGTAQHDAQQQAVQREDTAWNVVHAGDDEQHGRRDQHAEDHRLDDADEIGQRGETPDAAVQPEIPEAGRLHRQDEPQRRERGIEIEIGNAAEVEAQPIGQQPGDRDQQQVMQDGRRPVAEMHSVDPANHNDPVIPPAVPHCNTGRAR
jgi:hypothetical protein